MLADPGKWLVRALNIPAKSATSYAIQLSVAFFLSGVLHTASFPQDVPGLSAFRYGSFFWIQGLCVLFEVLVSRATHIESATTSDTMGEQFRKVVRTTWALGVLYFTIPVLGQEMVKLMLSMEVRPVFLFPVPSKGL